MSAAPNLPTQEGVFNLSLYQLTREYEAVIEAVIENQGELSEGLALQLAAIEDRFEVKAEKVALYIRNLLAMCDAANSEANRLIELARSREKTASALKQYLFDQMTTTGKEKIDRPLAKLSIVNVGGVLPVKWEGEPENIPEPYRITKTVYSLNRDQALGDHHVGIALPEGLTVGPRGKRLSIK